MGEASVVQWGSAVRHTPLASLSLGSDVPLTISDEADGSLGNNGGSVPVLGGFVAGGELAWRAAGPTVEVIDPLTGVRKAAWTFGAIMHNAGAKVTNVCGVGPGLITHVAVAVDLGADRKPQGMVAVLSLHTSRIIRTFHFKYKVTSLCMVSGGEVSVDPGTLSQELQVAHGLLALGTHHGTLHLLDLALDCKELMSDEVSPASIVQMSVPDPQAEAHRIQALKKRQHPSMCLSDGMVDGNQFRLIGPDENILYKTPSHLVTVTTLTFLPQLASLVVGYNFGSFQIINLSSIAVDCASPHEENMHPVHSFALQEPENDPKNFVYLWICRSYGLSDNTGSKSVIGRPALCTMYAMSYENKVWIEGHGLWYQHLSSISPRFEFEAIGGLGLNGQAAEPSRVFTAMTVRQATPVAASASSGAVALTNPDDESGPVPEWSLCLFGWYGGILSSGKVKVQHYIAVFDINQWYQAHMPNNLSIEESSLCPYMSFHALDQIPGHVTNKEAVLAASPKPASWARHISKCNNDTDWFPASLSFSAHVLTSEGLMEYQCNSVQQAALSTIARAGPPVIVNPEQAYALASFAGLLPPNDLNSSPQNMNMMKERDALLNIALEMQQMCLLIQCVTEFAEGRYTHRGCSLPTLLDWTWNKVHQVKASVDTLCGPLFDPSCGVISAEGIMTLHQNLTTLSSLTVLTQAIKDNSNSITAQGASELENRVMVVTLVQQYLGVVLWFYHCGLLAHSPVEDMLLEEAQVPFPAELLARIYNNRRIELKRLSTTISGTEILLIDGLIEEEDLKSAGNSMQGKIGSLWEGEGGCNQLYPPPSLQALLAVFLLPCVQPHTKHRIVQYLFLDLASLLSDGYVRIVEELVKYPSSFSLSPSHIKLTQAFWLIDHKDFQEGLNVLLDPLVNSNDISPEQHRRIIKAFLYQGESSRALTYAQIRQPPKMDLDDIRLHLTLLLANGRVREAFHYQRTHRVRDNTKDLLHHLFTGCEQLGRLESVVHLPLSGLEEAELLTYLRNSTHASAQDYLLVYYLQRARYSEAAILQEGLRNALGGVRKRHLARSSLLHAHITHLPDIAKKLATGSNDKTKPQRTIIQKPQPLSAQIRQSIVSPKSYSSNIAREMARVQGVRLTPKKPPGVMQNAFTPFRNNAQRRKYAGLESEDQLDEFADMFNQTKRNVSRDASHVVFPTLVDMNRSSHQSRLVEDEYEYCSPAKRSRLSEVSLMREDTNRLMESVLKRSMSQTLDISVTNTMNIDLLSLLTTPTVGKRPVPTSLSSIDTQLIDTPQSILKVRNFVKRPMSPSAASDTSQGPRFPRLPGTKKLISEDVLKVPSATPSETSTTPKQIRFDLPGLTNGQSTILMVDQTVDDLTFNNEEVDDVPGEPCHIGRSGQTPTPDKIFQSRSPSPRFTETTVSAPAKWLLSETVGDYEDAQETLSDAQAKEISSNDEEDMEATEHDACEELTAQEEEEAEEEEEEEEEEAEEEETETENHELENSDKEKGDVTEDIEVIGQEKDDIEVIEQEKDDIEVMEQEESGQDNSMLNVSHIPTPRKPLHAEAQAIGENVDQEEKDLSENIAVAIVNGSNAGENDATVNESYYSIRDTENSKVIEDVECEDELDTDEESQGMEQDKHTDGEEPQDMEIQQTSIKEIEEVKNMNELQQETEIEKEETKIISEDVVDIANKDKETAEEDINDVGIKSVQENQKLLDEVEIDDPLVNEVEIEAPLVNTVSKEQRDSILHDSVPITQVEETFNQTEELDQLIFSDSEEETEDNKKEKVTKRRSIRESESSDTITAKLCKEESFKVASRKSLNNSENIVSLVFSDSEESDNEIEIVGEKDASNVGNISSIDKVDMNIKPVRKSLNSSEYIPPIDISESEEEEELSIVKENLSKQSVQEKEIAQNSDSLLVDNALQSELHNTEQTSQAQKVIVIEKDVESSVFSDSKVSDNENRNSNENERKIISSIDKVEMNTKPVRKSLNSSEYIPSIDISDSEEEEELSIVKENLSKQSVQEKEIAQNSDSLLVDNAFQSELHNTEQTSQAQKVIVIEKDVEPSVFPDSKESDSENRNSNKNEQKIIGNASSTKEMENNSEQVKSLSSTELISPIEKAVSEEEIVKHVSSIVDSSGKTELQKTEESKVQTPKKNENMREMDRPLEEFLSALQETPEKFLFREPEKVQELHQSLTSAMDVQRGPEKFIFCEPEVVQDVRNSPRVYVEVYHDALNPDKMVIEVKKQLRMTPDRSPRRSTPDRSPKRNTPDRSPRRGTPNRSPGRSTPNRSPGRATPDRGFVNHFGEYQTHKNTSVHEISLKMHQKADSIPVVEEPCVVKQVWKCGEGESEMIIPAPDAFEDSVCESDTPTKRSRGRPRKSLPDSVSVMEDDKEKESNTAENQVLKSLEKSTEVSASIESQEIKSLESMDVDKSKPEEPKELEGDTPTKRSRGRPRKSLPDSVTAENQVLKSLEKSTEVSASIESQEIKSLESMDVDKSKPEEPKELEIKKDQASVDIAVTESATAGQNTSEIPTMRRSRRISESVDTDGTPSTPNRRSKRVGTPAGTPILDKPSTPIVRTRRNSTTVVMEAASPATAVTPRRSRRASISVEQPIVELGLVLGAVVTQDTPSKRVTRTSISLETASAAVLLPSVEVEMEAASPATAVTSRRSRRASISVEQPIDELGLVVGAVVTQDTPSKRVTRTSISLEAASAAVLLPSVEVKPDFTSNTTTPATPSRRVRRNSISTGTPASTTEVQDNSAAKIDTTEDPITESPATPSRRGRPANVSEEKPTADVDSPAATPGRRTRHTSLSVDQPVGEGEKTPATPSRGGRSRQSLDPAVAASPSTITPSTTPARKGRKSLSVEVPNVREEIRDLKDIGVTVSASPASPAITPSTPQRKYSRQSDVSTPLTEGEGLLSRTRSIRKNIETTPSSSHSKTITPSQVEKYLATSEEVKQVAVNLDAALNTVKNLSGATPRSANTTPVGTPNTTPTKGRRKSLESPLTPVTTPSRRSKRHGTGSAAPTPGTPSILEAISEETSVNTSEELFSNVTPVGTPHGTPAGIKASGTPAATVEQSPRVSHTPTKTTPRKRHPSKSSTVVETLEPISEDAEIKESRETTEAVSIPEPTGNDTLVEKKESDTPTKRSRGRPKKSPSKETETVTTSMETVSPGKKPSESSPKIDKETKDTPPSRPLTLRRSEASVRLLSPSVEVKTWSRKKSTRLSMLSTTAGSDNTIYKSRPSIAAVKLSIDEESGIDFTPQHLPKSRASRSVASSDSFILMKTRVHEESVSEQDSMLEESIAETETTINDVIMEGGLDNDELTEGEDDANTEAESSPELSANLLVSQLAPEEAEQHRRLSRRRTTSGFTGQSLRRKLLKRSIVAVKLPEDGPQLDETPEAPDTKSRRSNTMRKSLRSVDKSLRSVDSTILKMKLSEETITELSEETEGQGDSEPGLGSANNDASGSVVDAEDKKAKDFVFSIPIVEGRRTRNQEIGKPPKRFSPSREDDEEAGTKVVSTKRKR